jgi:hypothetical protein
MTHDDILRMAHLAGYIGSYADGGHGEQRFNFSKEQLIEFAALVAAHEREACAQVCDKRATDYRMGFEEKYEAQACAYDIRARGE